MHQINGRGTYLVSQACLPHLLESKANGREPHILNNSPVIKYRIHINIEYLNTWFPNKRPIEEISN